MPPVNDHTDVSSEARCQIICLSLNLHPYFVFASSQGSGEFAHMRKLTWAFVARKLWLVQNSRYAVRVYIYSYFFTGPYQLKQAI